MVYKVDPVIVGSVAVSVGPVIGRLASCCGGKSKSASPKFPPELQPYKPGQQIVRLLCRSERRHPLTLQASPCAA